MKPIILSFFLKEKWILLLEQNKNKSFLFVTVAPSAVHSLSNGRSLSSSSEEEEQGVMKNADTASAKSEDVKSEVGAKKKKKTGLI